MKAVILAGGMGTRLSEETHLRPKPMVEIGGKPILWHIMKIYATHGIKEFIVALGYKGEMIKEYFLNFYAFNKDISVDLETGKTTIHDGKQHEDWKVHLVDTGIHTQTGGRLKRLKKWLERDECFLFTYGDGVADIDIQDLIKFHQAHGKLATVTSVRTPARFGRMIFDDDQIRDQILEFKEKPNAGEGWINGGFFVFEPAVLDLIGGDAESLELDVLPRLVARGQLAAYRHDEFWQCMDTLRDKRYLESLWQEGRAPWRAA